MAAHLNQKNCPCSKGEYCANGLKCAELNCFLLKSPAIVTRQQAIQIESLNSLSSILSSDYRKSRLLYSFKYQRFDRLRENDSMEKI